MSPLDFSAGVALRVALIVGTRPEAIKLAPVAIALGANPAIDPLLWCTGQHPRWAPEMLAHFDLRPDLLLPPAPEGYGLTEMASQLLAGLQSAITARRPHVVVVQGDTLSAFAGALAASYARLPLVHVEAGLRSGKRCNPFPEEAHRRAIAAFADLHCAPTAAARDALIAERIPEADVLLSGNTVIDALRIIRERAPANDLTPPMRNTGSRLILVTCHRRENWGAPYRAVCQAAGRLAQREDCEVVFVEHPNPALSSTARAVLGSQRRLRLVPPLAYPPFMELLGRAALVLTDSGGVQEEAAALGVPLLVLRDSTERPEGVATGTAKLVGTKEATILAAAEALLDNPAALEAMRIPCELYGDGQAGHRIAAAISARWGRTWLPPATSPIAPQEMLPVALMG